MGFPYIETICNMGGPVIGIYDDKEMVLLGIRGHKRRGKASLEYFAPQKG